jgi:uncharacterized phage protein (TIGR01671 family)
MIGIELRAWDSDAGGWIDFSDASYFAGVYDTGEFTLRHEDDTSNRAISENVHAMLYTGLKDKNGKKIFDGDIVRCKVKDDKDKRRLTEHYVSDVFWDTDSWCVHDSPNCDTQLGRFDNQWPKKWPVTTIEVIGNVYESPELLERTQKHG